MRVVERTLSLVLPFSQWDSMKAGCYAYTFFIAAAHENSITVWVDLPHLGVCHLASSSDLGRLMQKLWVREEDVPEYKGDSAQSPDLVLFHVTAGECEVGVPAATRWRFAPSLLETQLSLNHETCSTPQTKQCCRKSEITLWSVSK